MKIERLEQLFQEEIQDLYDAEKQIIAALPKMVKAASSEELQEALNEHLEVTKGQVKRLEQIFESLNMKPKGKPCTGMKGIIEEGKELMEEDASEEMLDAALIGAAQRVEHYEISAYGTARTFAEQLGNSEAVDLLQQTLDEEKETDQKLTEISGNLLAGLTEESESEEAEGMETGGSASSKRSTATKAKRSSGR